MYFQNLFFNMNSMVMSEPYMVISQVHTYYTYSGPIFQYKFNGDVHFMIRLIIYGNFSNIHIL